MSPLVLPIFPEGSLVSSVITTVWVGVFVVCLLNLRLGWVLSGLVVPGYIAPLLIAKPVAAVVVIVEAGLTYALFWVLSEKLSGARTWSSFFGRDRFLGLILVSVAVRLSLDGLLLPIAANWLNRSYGFEFDWHNNLHSFGLVVIALFANQLWKPGFVRGMAQSLAILALTFLIIRYGLMELTNFRISGVVYLYEDFASSIFASPKAYIVLVVTCFVASRMNLRYGWDFGGILIPALLALQWYQPLKILASVVEGVVIYALGSLLLKTPFFANATVEGARKILLFFNISFAYKMVLGHVLASIGTEHRITDYYGFGYLLPTLIAIKAYEKDILPRVGRAVLQISFVGAVVGSAVGFALVLLVPDRSGAEAAAQGREGPPSPASVLVAQAVGSAHAAAAMPTQGGMDRVEAETFASGIGVLDGGGSLKEAVVLLSAAGYKLTITADRLVAVAPTKPGTGVLFVFNPRATQDLSIVVPDPASQPGLGLAAARLFNAQQARWLAIGGESAGVRTAQRPAVPLPLFRRAAVHAEMVVRPGAPNTEPVLQLAGAAVAGVELHSLRELLAGLRLEFTSNAQAAGNPDSSTLFLPPRMTQRLVGTAHPRQQLSFGQVVTQARGVFAEGRETRRQEPARVLSLPELAFLRFEVLEPLLSGSDEGLRAAAASAEAVGFQVFETESAGPDRLIVLRRAQSTGAYLIRPGARDRPIIQVAADEEASAVDAATRVFQGLRGSAFLIAPYRADLEQGEGGLVTAITQSLLRASEDKHQLTLQVRTAPESFAPAGHGDVVIAGDRLDATAQLALGLQQRLSALGFTARPHSWGEEAAGLEAPPSPHLSYLEQSRNKRFAIVWVPRSRRAQPQ